MIRFDLVSSLPKYLTESDLRRLGALLGTSFRFRQDKRVGLRFVSLKEMQRLNRAYHRCDRPTDVLSFAPSSGKAFPVPSAAAQSFLGDIVVCPAYAQTEARRRGIESREEILRLLVHGVLHLKGLNHRTAREEQKMFSLQERLLNHVLVQTV